MGIVITWIILSFVVGAIGSSRTIGFGGAFFASLFLSPVIGFILVLTSKDKEDIDNQKKQEEVLSKIENNTQKVGASNITDELKKLKELLDEGVLTTEEFEMQKKKLLSN